MTPTHSSGLGGLCFLESAHSQILNQKPQTVAMCSLSCCAWSGLVMHLDQPGGRPSNQYHIRDCFTIFRATQLLIQDAIYEGLIPLCIFKNQEKKNTRCETRMIPVRVGQDQTHPSFMKECKQLSTR